MPSRFIGELPENLIEISDSSYINQNKFMDEVIDIENINDEYLSPGRKRLLEKSKNQIIDWDLNQDFENYDQPIIGQRVFHQKYGYGKLLSIDGDKAKIKFEKSDIKTIFIKYINFTH